MRAEYIIVSVVIALIVLAIAIAMATGMPNVVNVVKGLFGHVPK